MNTPTPTPETDASRHDLSDYGIPVPCSYGDWVPFNVAERLERKLAAVTEQLKAAQDGWHDEITKGLSELKRAESIYTKAQERAERAIEQRDRLAEAMQTIIRSYENIDKGCIPSSSDMYDVALQSLNQPTP